MDLLDLPQGIIPAEMLDAIRTRALREIEELASGKRSEIANGQESPALAALQFMKYASGIAFGLSLAGIRASDLQKRVDVLARELDPQFLDHQRRRWASRPADLAYTDP